MSGDSTGQRSFVTEVLYLNKTPFCRSAVVVSVFAWSGHHEMSFASAPPPMSITELLGGKRSRLSTAYRCQQTSSCLRLLRQFTAVAFSLALAIPGKSSAASMAMIAITTSSSTSVNALELARGNGPEARIEVRRGAQAVSSQLPGLRVGI